LAEERGKKTKETQRQYMKKGGERDKTLIDNKQPKDKLRSIGGALVGKK